MKDDIINNNGGGGVYLPAFVVSVLFSVSYSYNA